MPPRRAEAGTKRERVPVASRPHMPGYDMMFDSKMQSLPWSWAVRKLSESRNYWLATTRPDGRPHVMPVWGLWDRNLFYFSTGRDSRKSRNLRSNPNCTICPENIEEAVILEGTANEVKDASLLKEITRAYERKYDWKMEGNEGPFYGVVPVQLFGFVENPKGKVRGNPTRWRFSTR